MTEKPMTAQEEQHAREFLRDAQAHQVFSLTMARKLLATIDQLREKIEQLRGNA
jgi:hypothetical protein